MPAFSGQFNWRDGIVWQAGFVVADKEIPAIDRIHICSALVDTGASVTISSSVAKEIELVPKGKTEIQNTSGIEEVNVYDVQPVIILSNVPSAENKATMAMQAFEQIPSPEFNPGDNIYKALIGRDILQQGLLTLSFDGHYTFSY